VRTSLFVWLLLDPSDVVFLIQRRASSDVVNEEVHGMILSLGPLSASSLLLAL